VETYRMLRAWEGLRRLAVGTENLRRLCIGLTIAEGQERYVDVPGQLADEVEDAYSPTVHGGIGHERSQPQDRHSLVAHLVALTSSP